MKIERFDEFMRHVYKVPGTNKQVIKKLRGLERHQLFTALEDIDL